MANLRPVKASFRLRCRPPRGSILPGRKNEAVTAAVPVMAGTVTMEMKRVPNSLLLRILSRRVLGGVSGSGVGGLSLLWLSLDPPVADSLTKFLWSGGRGENGCHSRRF